MNFAERAPSTDWTPLEYGDAVIAEAWVKPDGEPFTLVLRVPRDRFDLDVTEQVSLEDLLTAAGVPEEEVDSWQLGDVVFAAEGGANPELKRLLPPPPADETHLTVRVRLMPPADGPVPDVPPEVWQSLEFRWKAILTLEAGVDALRQTVESLRLQMESAFRQTLTVEDKVHALQSDVAAWNKAKGRVHYAVPKAREFIHRATWALGVPERKRLDEVHKQHIEPRVPFAGIDRVREQLDHLQKDRQVLSAQGAAAALECRGVLGEIQNALGTLQRNARENAARKRSAKKEKGKHF